MTPSPLTPPEWPEWGNPLTDKQAYKNIAAYSPYDNVAKRDTRQCSLRAVSPIRA